MLHIVSLYLVRDTRGRGSDRVTLTIQRGPAAGGSKNVSLHLCVYGHAPLVAVARVVPGSESGHVCVDHRAAGRRERFSGRRAAAPLNGASGQWSLWGRVYARRIDVVFLLLATGFVCGG
jgi:hypothetical protein